MSEAMDNLSRTDSESDTIAQSGSHDNHKKKTRPKSGRTPSKRKLKGEDEIAFLRSQVEKEKAGKRKLFHSLVKIAKEFEKVQAVSKPLRQRADYADQTWYEGGMWRAPVVLPSIEVEHKRTRPREPISLSNLFFNIVIVTAFTRIGAATNDGIMTTDSFLYFALFYFAIWYKETSYSTRFDTTDLSTQLSSLMVCFVVLFASLSVSNPIASEGGTRIMIVAAFCAFLNMCLMGRVWVWFHEATPGHIDYHVREYAIFNTLMNLAEVFVWVGSLLFVPESSPKRWMAFAIGVAFSFRLPRAFMANDFHAACSKRGVIFLLLLGFMLQGVMVVASEFFPQDQSPSIEQYSFIGASCMLLFCIKLLYVEDGAVAAGDHALLINRTAGFFFHIGQFGLLLGMIILGNGLNMLAHSFLSATAALPSNAKDQVCIGFGAVVFFIAFVKSMHLKRVPIDPQERRLFIAAHLVPVCTTLTIVGIMAAICFDRAENLREILWRSDIGLLWMVNGCAMLLVVLSWIDEALELALFKSKEHESNGGNVEFLTSPFGIWWCLTSEVSADQLNKELDEVGPLNQANARSRPSTRRLSALSPLLGESVASLKGYEALSVEGSERGSDRDIV